MLIIIDEHKCTILKLVSRSYFNIYWLWTSHWKHIKLLFFTNSGKKPSKISRAYFTKHMKESAFCCEYKWQNLIYTLDFHTKQSYKMIYGTLSLTGIPWDLSSNHRNLWISISPSMYVVCCYSSLPQIKAWFTVDFSEKGSIVTS